jgi:hypothetical protein
MLRQFLESRGALPPSRLCGRPVVHARNRRTNERRYGTAGAGAPDGRGAFDSLDFESFLRITPRAPKSCAPARRKTI